jgi:hypothetical protein
MKRITQQHEIYYDEMLKAILLSWKGFPSREQIRLAAGLAIELMQTHAVTKFLNDQSALPELFFDQDDWVADTWFPKIVDGGVEKYAVVVSQRHYEQLPEAIKRSKQGKIEIQYFTDLEKAKKWL